MTVLSDWVAANKDDPDCELNIRGYKLNTELYERDYANAVATGKTIVVCQHCGYPTVMGSSSEDEAMEKHQACFSCWFWLHHSGLANGPTKRSIIVGGQHYIDGGNKPKERSAFLGFGGSKWYYRRIGETEYVETNNMWFQGKIPARLKIADTHEFKPHEQVFLPLAQQKPSEE